MGGDYLLAISTSRPYNTCGLDLYTDGPPTRLQLIHHRSDGKHKLLYEEQGKAILGKLDVVPYDGGAWVVYQRFAGGEVEPVKAFRVKRLDTGGAGSSASFQVGVAMNAIPSGMAFAGWTATAFGQRLAVGWQDTTALVTTFAVRHFDEYTSTADPPQIVFSPAPKAEGPLSILGAPSGNELAVAWAVDTDITIQHFLCAN